MNKNELLAEIAKQVDQGVLTQKDVLSVLKMPAKKEMNHADSLVHGMNVNKLLYVLGGVIVLIGIIFFIWQIWTDIASVGRVLVTLGMGLLLLVLGSLLLMNKKYLAEGLVFHVLGGLLIPTGVLVLLYELDLLVNGSPWLLTVCFGVVAALYVLLSLYHKRSLLTFFAIAFATVTVNLFTYAILDTMYSSFFDTNVYHYLAIAVGVGYILLARSFVDTWNKRLLPVLHFFGTFGILMAGYLLVYEFSAMFFIYFLFVFAGLYVSTVLRSTSMLVLSTLFFLAHMAHITSEYFADSLGWPISLVVLGFIIIGMGYGSFTLNKEYIQK